MTICLRFHSINILSGSCAALSRCSWWLLYVYNHQARVFTPDPENFQYISMPDNFVWVLFYMVMSKGVLFLWYLIKMNTTKLSHIQFTPFRCWQCKSFTIFYNYSFIFWHTHRLNRREIEDNIVEVGGVQFNPQKSHSTDPATFTAELLDSVRVSRSPILHLSNPSDAPQMHDVDVGFSQELCRRCQIRFNSE